MVWTESTAFKLEVGFGELVFFASSSLWIMTGVNKTSFSGEKTAFYCSLSKGGRLFYNLIYLYVSLY